MKKRSSLVKILICITLASMSVFFFAGCQSKSKNNTSNTNNSGSRPNAAQMQQKMQDDIKPLISDGTITQDQADKIVEAMTNRPRGNGKNNQQNGGKNSHQNKAQSNGQIIQRSNPLSKLVSDGVITQAQADTVMQKISSNFGNRNNNQVPQNNNTQSSN